MEKITDYTKLKGQAIAKFARRLSPLDPNAALAYLILDDVKVLISKMLPGDEVSGYIFSDAVIRGSHKFTTRWDDKDLDVLMEILRLGFVAGIMHEKYHSNRSRSNFRNSNVTKRTLQDLRGKQP